MKLINSNYKRALLLLLLCVCSKETILLSQDYTAAQNKIKAIYVYNFIKYVRWPGYVSDGELRICALSDEGLYKELTKLSIGRKVNDRNIIVNQVSNTSNCAECDVYFLGNKSVGQRIATDCSSFTITDNDASSEMSNITLVYKDRKLNFEINEPLCEAKGYFIASKLKQMAL